MPVDDHSERLVVLGEHGHDLLRTHLGREGREPAQIAEESDDLAAALKNLAVALSEVSSFVHDNRASLTTNLDQLASVTGTVAKQRDALAIQPLEGLTAGRVSWVKP